MKCEEALAEKRTKTSKAPEMAKASSAVAEAAPCSAVADGPVTDAFLARVVRRAVACQDLPEADNTPSISDPENYNIDSSEDEVAKHPASSSYQK